MILPSEVHIAARNKNPKLVKVSIPGSTKSVTFLFTQLVDYYVTEVTFVCTNLQRDFIIIHVLAEKKLNVMLCVVDVRTTSPESITYHPLQFCNMIIDMNILAYKNNTSYCSCLWDENY